MKLAITGMDVVAGGCDGLDAFEQLMYSGQPLFSAPPAGRWPAQTALKVLLKHRVGEAFGLDPQDLKMSPGQVVFKGFSAHGRCRPETDAEAP